MNLQFCGWQIHLRYLTRHILSPATALSWTARHLRSLFYSGALAISQRLRPAENCGNNLHCLTVPKLSFLCGDVCRSPFTGLFTFSGTFLWPFLCLFLSAKVLFHFPRAVWLDTESWVPAFCSASLRIFLSNRLAHVAPGEIPATPSFLSSAFSQNHRSIHQRVSVRIELHCVG